MLRLFAKARPSVIVQWLVWNGLVWRGRRTGRIALKRIVLGLGTQGHSF